MFSRTSAVLRSRLARGMMQPNTQRRAMGGGGKFMETNNFGVQVGEVFGTIAWLWIFYRFSQDGKVLLGYEHPWEHGHHGGDHGHGHSHKKLTADERATSWEAFADKAIKPGDDDDDEDEDEDEDDED